MTRSGKGNGKGGGRRTRLPLANEVALVTGGSRGLGLLIARELGLAGCRVAICARDEGELDAAESWLAAAGVDAFAVPCDVRDKDDVGRTFDSVRAQLGPVDLLVNNAGVMHVAPLDDTNLDDFHTAHDVMFWGMLHCSMEALRDMRATGRGRIANVTSIGGAMSVPHLLPYCTAKAAAVSLSEGLDVELRSAGIRVTTILPGTMRTGSHVNAEMGGDQAAEYRWFSLAATIPLFSMSAERAARRIVKAIRRGERHVVLGAPAKAAFLAHGVFPGAVDALLARAARLMPYARRVPLTSTLTGLGEAAARKFQHRREGGDAHAAR